MATTTIADNLKDLIRRFDSDCVQVFQGAISVCASRAHFEIAPEHLMLRLLDETAGDVTQILTTFRVDRARLRRAIQTILDEQPTGHHGKPVVSAKLVELLGAAAVLADEMGFEQIRPGLLILALVLNPGLSRIAEVTPELERIDADQFRDRFSEIVSTAQEPATGSAKAADRGRADCSALEQYTVDLTAKAAAGQIDPVFGREHEIRQMIDIFARRRKNNPILVGEPGTGKTAIVEGLAMRIAHGDVPPALQGVKLVSLDLGLLQAGAGVKGEFENRLKNVISAIKSSPTPMITFIDEAHTLIGAGGTAGGSDAANLLKPALARGELRTVAATTWAEYKKYFEKDAALERRFQLVRCEEPSVETTVVILRGLKEIYEKHHKVVMLDDAITEAAQLSNRYISGRFLPDKAVDLLDTAAARVAVSLTTRPANLEDIDRKIHHLDTAIVAVERDMASGASNDHAKLKSLNAARDAMKGERATIETQWTRERDAVNRLIEARTKLFELRAASAGNPAADRAVPEGDGKPREAAPPDDCKPSMDELGLRREIEEAAAELKQIQGDCPMLHPQVDAAAVGAVVSDWTGIPVGRMVKDEIAATLGLEQRLGGRVLGQDHVLGMVANKLRTAKSGLGNPTQPMGVFLCVGPSGVGKTELALAVSDLLFGGERFTITINMSEFMEKHTVSQLKGSPPGYVGYGEGGVLTEAVRQRPYSVVLLDEVEKAHPDVLNLFYQVFDKGNLADGEGRVINFKNTVIFLTTNLATDVIQSMCESGQPVGIDELKEAVYPHLREHFKPALLARMTVIPFFTLPREVMKSISKLKLRKLGDRLATAHGIEWNVADPVYDSIAERCTQVDVGARNIDHILDQIVLPELSRRLLEQMGDNRKPSSVTMETDEVGAFRYRFADGPELTAQTNLTGA